MTTRLEVADSLAQVADNALWFAERQRDKSDGVLEDLKRAYPELERRASEIEAERNLALENAMEARLQEQGKQVALDEARTARMDEAEQRRIAESRADSLAREKRVTDNLNQQKTASLVAQNSMALKGDPQLRGLMAVYALRSLEQSGGDVNSEEVVRALQESLRILQLGREPGAKGFRKPAQYLVPALAKNKLFALGNDGRYLSINVRDWSKKTETDLTAELDVLSGKAFLAASRSEIILTDRDGGIRVHDANSGALIASVRKSPHIEDIRAASSVGPNGIIVCGDLSGLLTIWKRNGTKLELVKSHQGKGKFRTLIDVPGRSSIVGVDGTGDIVVVLLDGNLSTVTIPGGEAAWSIAHAGTDRVVVGTKQGRIWTFDLKDRRLTSLSNESGPAVESLLFDAPTGRLAWVNGAKLLTLRSPDSATQAKDFRMDLGVIPNTMAFGSNNVIYISTSEGILPVICDSRTIADRICEFVGRSWSQEEWDQQIGKGTPNSTCSGL